MSLSSRDTSILGPPEADIPLEGLIFEEDLCKYQSLYPLINHWSHLSICSSTHLCIYSFIHSSIHLSISLSIHLSIYPPMYTKTIILQISS